MYRGVRQGNLLFCLLFDLMIEPLSVMIWTSDLKGIDLPKCCKTFNATLFADDTTIYLAKDDNFEVLQEILDTWCSAAKAKFNIKKMEILPIGSPTFRAQVVEAYRVDGTWNNCPRGV